MPIPPPAGHPTAIVLASLIHIRTRGSHVFFLIVLRAQGTGVSLVCLHYSSYGEVRGGFGGLGNALTNPTSAYRYWFTAYESEFSSGLRYPGARFHDRALGMFLTHDPARQFPSPYAYGPWDPVNGSDPSGAVWGWILALAVIAAVGIDVGLGTGDPLAAWKASVIAGVTSVLSAGLAQAGLAVVQASAMAAGAGETAAQWIAYTVGFASGGYGVGEAAQNGMYATAAVGALLLAVGGRAYRRHAGGVRSEAEAAQGANGAGGLSQEQQLRGNAGAFDQRYGIGGVTYGGREDAGTGWLGTIKKAAGLIWTLPNTVIGTAYGLLGIPTGGIGFEYGQLQFKGNLLQWLFSGGGNAAITLGDAGIYPPGFSPETVMPGSGSTLGFEESFHSLQGRILGPLYLPAHLVFGTSAVIVNGNWHGPVNLLERGPHASPPRVF